MSLNSEYKTHVDEDVDFTMSFDTYDSKKQANIREIKARLENISTLMKPAKWLITKSPERGTEVVFLIANISHAPNPQDVCKRY